jgi:hypothetical protein
MSPAPSFLVRLTQHPDRKILLIAWIIILLKCLLTPWVIAHWAIPVAAAWIVMPTLIFAVLATWIWVVHKA